MRKCAMNLIVLHFAEAEAGKGVLVHCARQHLAKPYETPTGRDGVVRLSNLRSHLAFLSGNSPLCRSLCGLESH